MAQKARREVKEKAREEAKRQRVAEKKKKKKKKKKNKKKKRTLEYLQQLWDKVLEEKTALLERAEGFQVTGFKCKEIATGDEGTAL